MRHQEIEVNADGLITCDYISYGDYDNSCAVERANVRYLKERDLIERKETGGYGYVKAWLLDTPENRELLEGLFDYPCFDDELVSQVEDEIEEEYIKDNDDITRLYTDEPLRSILQDNDMACIIPDIYYAAKEQANMQFEVQAGGNGWIDLKRLAKDYNLILCEKNPVLRSIVELRERVTELECRDGWNVCGFFDAAEMLHAVTLGNQAHILQDPEIMLQVLRYAAECEAR